MLDINLGTCLRPSAVLSSTSWHSVASSLHCREIVPSGSCREQVCYSYTTGHPFLGCKCLGSCTSIVQPERSPPVFTASMAFAKFCITFSLADNSQLGSSCSLTTVTGPISPKTAIQQQSCYFLYSFIPSISFFFAAKH